jgi:hypothetical protein
VPISNLITTPYDLPWGSGVYAKIQAINAYGTSDESDPGNGAVILTNPDKPINLANDPSQTTGTQISLTWAEGIANGGAPVLDYKVWSDQAENIYVPLIEGLQNIEFIATGLSVGFTYNFKVQARNEYDFSDYSDVVTILAA